MSELWWKIYEAIFQSKRGAEPNPDDTTDPLIEDLTDRVIEGKLPRDSKASRVALKVIKKHSRKKN